MSAHIDILDVRKSFGRTRVLDGVSFRIEPGQSVALWGSNGAGKTTLIRCALGLIDFDGAIRVAGLDVRRDGKRVRRLLGYVPQELAFYDDFRVIEAARFLARIKGAEDRACQQRLEELGLAAHARKRVRELSGGMKQRLALSIALLNDPPVLVLDEPTSNLDSAARRSLMSLLLDLKHAGKTILFISHRPEEVRGLADRVLTLEYGKVVADAAAADGTLDAEDDFLAATAPGHTRHNGHAHVIPARALAIPVAR
jgi:ABC-2 type transport system ATP-binding protein/nitrous oxidase accessory protein